MADDDRAWGFRTRAVHAGGQPDPTTGARAVPIYQTTSFVFEDADDAADLFALQKYGNIYARLGNPTVAAFEERMASLEGGIGAVATASGQSAGLLVFAALCGAGDHIVSSAQLYGGTRTLLESSLARFGITTTFVASSDPADYAAAVTAAHPADPHRDRRQPVGRGRRPRGPGRRRPRRRPAPGRRQHDGDAVPLPADGVGRRHRRPLGDQVHRRSRQLARRRGHRVGPLRLGQRAASR